MPLVSVIIPTYNRAHTIKRAISSVLNQTFQNFEIIVIDDGSSDDTKKVISQMNENRIKYYYINHSGISAARNIGIHKSHSEYIAFLDSDDEYYPKLLENQINFFKNFPRIGMVFTYSDFYLNDKFVYSWNRKISGKPYPNLLLIKNNLIATPSVMTKRSILHELGGFNEKLLSYEDSDLWLRILKKYKFYQIKKILVKVNISDSKENLITRKQFYDKCMLNYPDLNYFYSYLINDLIITNAKKELLFNYQNVKARKLLLKSLTNMNCKYTIFNFIKILPYFVLSFLNIKFVKKILNKQTNSGTLTKT